MTQIRSLVATAAALLLGSTAAWGQQSWANEVPMRDGVKLKTTVWVPGEGSYPVVVGRGYSETGLKGAAEWNKAGYAFVCQQCRGNGGEDGSLCFSDDKDGYDCVEWVAKQPWSNGKVAMWGGSYGGVTQWRPAVAQPPALRAMIAGYTSAAHSNWEQRYWIRGALHLRLVTQGRVFPTGSRFTPDEWKRKLMFLPLIDMDAVCSKFQRLVSKRQHAHKAAPANCADGILVDSAYLHPDRVCEWPGRWHPVRTRVRENVPWPFRGA